MNNKTYSKKWNKSFFKLLIFSIISILLYMMAGTSEIMYKMIQKTDRLANTATETYIYDVIDMVTFRDDLNNGDNYAGKTVYLMSDVDLSTVCSESLGSWEPGGKNGIYFAGTFNGQYHAIKNLYINTTEEQVSGLFSKLDETAIVQNVIMQDVDISNNYNVSYNNAYVGAIAGWVSEGAKITNCGINSGSVTGKITEVNSSCGQYGPAVGGIAGRNNGTIESSFNKASITSYAPTSTGYADSMVGGIAGANFGTVRDSYNTGEISSTGYTLLAGGIAGIVNSSYSGSMTNAYNSGNISTNGTYKYCGGLIGRNGTDSFYNAIPVTNSYSVNNVGNLQYYYNGAAVVTTTSGITSSGAMQSYSAVLGEGFTDDENSINTGFPILYWETDAIKLDVKQTYIKVDEELKINLTYTNYIDGIIDEPYEDYVTWASSNPDVATVDLKGNVTGVSDGYTTIYAYLPSNQQYAMCVVNVASNKANPQVETGEGFITTLKSNGTVWSLGKNDVGQLGNGVTGNQDEEVQVKIDENTYLENVVKISSGMNFAVALTETGKVYSWGANNIGQLGQNNTNNSNYAQLVVGENGEGILSNIVDISCGGYGVIALDQDGQVYVWGNGSYGEFGNDEYKSSIVPVKNYITKAISVSGGAGHNVMLLANGKVYSAGNNQYGQLGIGNTTNSATIQKIADNVTEISASGFETLVKDKDGKVYATGLNDIGQLGTGNITNLSTLTEINLPSETAKVKYIRAGRNTTAILLDDGTVYSTGSNKNGELGNSTNIATMDFVQALTKDSITEEFIALENVLNVGRQNGESSSLNTSIICQNGRVYETGDNTYYQIGNEKIAAYNYYEPVYRTETNYPAEISIEKGANSTLTEQEFSFASIYVNVFNQDKEYSSFINHAEMLNTNIATYSNGSIVGQRVGTTMFMAENSKKEETYFIPVRIRQAGTNGVTDVQNGTNFTVVLKSNGTVWTCGTNQYGQLGIGTANYKNIPEQVETLKDEIVKEIAVGTNHSLALTESGKVYSWGVNANGQLGLGTTINSSIPQEVANIVENEAIVKIIAENNTSYAITGKGKIYAWGNKYTSKPTLINVENTAIDITENYYLTITGDVYRLADNMKISLSYNEYDPTEEPVLVNEKIVQISEGTEHLVLLGESGNVYSYGINTYGGLGDGTTISRTSGITTAVRISETDKLTNILKISAGDGYSVAIAENGKAYAWGKNEYGELGKNPDVSTNGIQESFYAIEVGNISEATNINSGKSHVSISNTTGEVFTLGSGAYGELGNGENIEYYEPQEMGKNIIESNTNEIVLEVGENFDIDSSINYFNLYNEIDPNFIYNSLDSSMVTVDNDGNMEAIAQGRTTIRVTETASGKTGVINVRILAEGTRPASLEENAQNKITIEPQVATAGSHTITLKVDGTVWSYGQNSYGELGTEDTEYSDVPVQTIFPEGTVITKIATGEEHSIALDSDGYVWVWGRNRYYQLGNTTAEFVSIPEKIVSITGIKDIECGDYSSFVITESGDVYSFGLNGNGECGVGSYTNRIGITKAKYLTNIIDIKAGKNNTIALKSNGEVFVTGSNLYGELGNGNKDVRKTNIFTKVTAITDIVQIGAGTTNNLALDSSGKVYCWGSNVYGELGINSEEVSIYTPTQISDISNIRYLEGGKNTSTLIDNLGNVYMAGLNKLGSLGNTTTTDINKFEKLTTISDVIYIAQGNNYTTYLKSDGMVYGSGDYNQGNTELKSKTRGVLPIQVGNDKTRFKEKEILVKVNGTKDILANFEFEFNLIKEQENIEENLTYASLNLDIATIDLGIATGVKTGKTWIKIVNQATNEVYIIQVNVVEDEYVVSPKVEAGENFAVTLKGDGTVYTYGYNGQGVLADGTYVTKDVPTMTNILATYNNVEAGKDFFVALRSDNTVWATGANTYGQLGIGNTNTKNILYQINGISDVVQIATGASHTIALDSYGIVYGWGRNTEGQLGISNIGKTTLSPTNLGTINETIVDISAGGNQSVIVTSSGKVYGMGNILNGYLTGMEDAVKVEVGSNYLLILTKDGNVYKFNGSLSTVTSANNVIDISVANNTNMCQTIDEKTYTWGDNSCGQLGNNQTINTTIPQQSLEHSTNTYSIGAGYNNTYIVENSGLIYVAGDNEYGSLGNSTRNASLIHTLVGDRKFDINPINEIMTINDIETPEIIANTFSVFNTETKDTSEYTWESNDADIVYANNGTLTAYNEGTAIITVTDTVTGQAIEIERYVQEIDKQRIDSINVNSVVADVTGFDEINVDTMTYKVKVETDEAEGELNVKTLDATDTISLSKDDWTTNVGIGEFTTTVNLPTKTTEVPLYIKSSNGTILTYMLTVEKISSDIGIKKITVTSGTDLSNPDKTVEAKAVSSTEYEVSVSEDTTVTLTDVVTNSVYAYASIDGKAYTLNEQTKNIVLGDLNSKEVKIIIKGENEKEQEYTLKIYKENEAANLQTLTVNNQATVKISDRKYSITVANDTELAQIHAQTSSSLVGVSIENNEYNINENTNAVELANNPQEVSVKVKVEEDNIKEYTLEIYKESATDVGSEDDLKLDMLIVNDSVITRDSSGNYVANLPNAEITAQVRAIAADSTNYVQISTNIQERGESSALLQIPDPSNTVTIKLSNEEGKLTEYTLIINKAEYDTTLCNVQIQIGNSIKEVNKIDNATYEVKVPADCTECDVTAATTYIKANVKIGVGSYTTDIATENITLSTGSTITPTIITVQSSNGLKETQYTLNIVRMSKDVDLNEIYVNEVEATWDETAGAYRMELEEALRSVTVQATAMSESATIKINSNEYELNTTTKTVAIDSKETIATITVLAEDGTSKAYKLIITGLPDNTEILNVVVNNENATYKDGEGIFEIRLDASEYNIEVTPEDLLAKLQLGSETQVTGVATSTVQKTEDETRVKLIVTPQNELDVEEYEIVIKAKSNDSTISDVIVDGKTATKTEEGNYEIAISEIITVPEIKIQANDEYATVYLADETQNTNNMIVTKELSERETIYTIRVNAENGEYSEQTLTITRLSNNTDIQNVDIITTNTETLQDTTYTPTLQENGTYYIRIPRVEKAKIKVTSSNENALVKIKNSEYVLIENEVEIGTIGDVTDTTISIQAEDGTIKEYPITLEKMSCDTGVTADIANKFKQDAYTIYVDEGLTQVDLDLVADNEYAGIKLSTETEYTLKQVTKTITLSSSTMQTLDENESISGWKVTVNVKAEDGTIADQVITIIKIGDTELNSVKIAGIDTANTNGVYKNRINVATTATVEVVAKNVGAKIQIIEISSNDTETVLATGTGSLSSSVTLSTNPISYILRVTSSAASTITDHSLVIEQKSQDTGISYVKVDSVQANIEADGTYAAAVSKKETYPVEIQTTDENAEVKISYDEYVGTYTKAKITENVPVEEDTTKTITISVKSENGEESEYTLAITGKSTDTDIGSITVENLVNGEKVAVQVIKYDEATKTYTIGVSRDLIESTIIVNTSHNAANVVLNDVEPIEVGTNSINATLSGLGIETITMKVIAEDGTIDTKYLNIAQLSDDIGLEKVEVDGVELTANSSYNYEVTVTDENSISNIYAKALTATATVSINNDTATVNENTYSLTKGNTRQFIIPIKVTAEDTITEYTYNLTVNVISHDSTTEYVKLDSVNTTTSTDLTGKTIHTGFIDAYGTSTNVEIQTGVEYSKIRVSPDNLNAQTESENISFTYTTTDLDVQEFIIPYTVIAEDESETEYEIHLIRKDLSTAIESVYVNNNLITADEEGNYYTTILDSENRALVKVTTESAYATVNYDASQEINTLEKTININTTTGLTTVTLTITSQQGESETKTLTIESVSNDNNLQSVKVNDENPEIVENEINSYVSYIYDTINECEVTIKATSEYATVQQITIDEEENVTVIQGAKSELIFNATTTETLTEIFFRIVAEDGTTSDVYKLVIEKRSTDTTLKEIYVNGELVIPDENGKYIARILDNEGSPTVKAITNYPLANVRIALGDESIQIAEKTVPLSAEKQTIIPITVRSHAGLTVSTNLYVEVIATSFAFDMVTIENKECNSYNEDTHTYEFIVDKDLTQYELYAATLSTYANITYDGTEYGESLTTLIDLDTALEGKSITLKTTSESGNEQEYTITLIRESDNINLEYLKVDNVLREPEEDGITYTVMIKKDQPSVNIEVATAMKYSTMRLGDLETVRNVKTAMIECDLNEGKIIIPIIVTAPNGIDTETYNIVLMRGSDDTSIELKVNDNVVIEDSNGDYAANVIQTDEVVNIEGTVTATSLIGETAGSIDINLTGEYAYPTKQIQLTNADITGKRNVVVPIVVIAEDGTTRESILTLTVLSTDCSQNSIVVNETSGGKVINRTPEYNDVTDMYETKIKYATSTLEVVVNATDSNATIEQVDSTGNSILDEDSNKIEGKGTLTFNANTTENTSAVYYKITSEAGTTTETYTLKIDKMSDNTLLEKVEVNDVECISDMNGNYSIEVQGGTTLASVVVTPDSSKQTIKINGIATANKEITLADIQTQVIITVIAEDGTEKLYTLTIKQQTNISGKITTENTKGIHKSIVTVYKTADINPENNNINMGTVEPNTGSANGEREVIDQVTTADDGTFVLTINDIEKYDIVITKLGYLDYRVTDIEVTNGTTTTIDEYNLVAGDTMRNGEIELSDLICVTDSYNNGTAQLRTSMPNFKEICDLNGDGIVNSLDRNIVKKNYSRKQETVVWVDPNTIIE